MNWREMFWKRPGRPKGRIGIGVVAALVVAGVVGSALAGHLLLAHFRGGDITSIVAGVGLTGGAANGAATLAIDTKYALPQSCTSGQVAKWDGSSWMCDADEGTGESLVTREVIVTSDRLENTFDGFDLKLAQAKCAEDEVITGGGFRIFGASRPIENQVTVRDSLAGFQGGNPTGQSPNVWAVVAKAPAGIGNWGIDARAICAHLEPSG